MRETVVEDLLERGKRLALADRTAEAEEALQEALQVARGNSLLESRVCCSLGTFYARDGRQFEAIMLYRYGLDQSRRAGDALLEVRLLANLCAIFTELERWDPLATHLGQADIVIASLPADRREEAEDLIVWSRFYWSLRTRDVVTARAHLTRVLEFMKQHPDPSSTALLRAWEADLLMLEGAPMAALDVLEDARELKGVAPSYALDVLCRMIECLVVLEHDEEADRLSRQLLHRLEVIGERDSLAQVSHETAATLGRYFDRRGQDALALRAYDLAATTALRRIVELADCIERIPELADTREEDHHHLRALRGEYLGVHREILDRVARLLERSPDSPVFRGTPQDPTICVCAWCGLVGAQEGQWIPVAHLVPSQLHVPVSHGVCPRCAETSRTATGAPG